MEKEINYSRIFLGPENIRLFWSMFIIGVILTIVGVLLGNPFEDYQTAATL